MGTKGYSKLVNEKADCVVCCWLPVDASFFDAGYPATDILANEMLWKY